MNNGVACFACKKLLECQQGLEDATEQFDNNLWIEFSGGYGMFIDPMEKWADYKITICHECAHDLCDKVPWIGHLLYPHGSHSHTDSYHQEHPEHYGWDYSMRKLGLFNEEIR